MTVNDSPARVFSPLVVVLRAFCQGHGVDPEPALRAHGITEGHLADPEARVPYAILIDLWDELVRVHPGRPLGLEYGAHLDMSVLGLYTLLGLHSQDIRTSIQRSIRFQRLFDPMFTLELSPVPQSDLHELKLRHAVEDTHPEVMEMMMSSMCLSAQRNVGETKRAELRGDPRFEAWFKHPRRHPLEAYTELIDARLRFEAPYFALRMPSDWLDLPLPGATPGVSVYLERELLKHEAGDADRLGFKDRVQSEIERRLADGEVDQERVARAVSVSVRTMQRRLREEQTSFQNLLEQARRVRAEALLRNTDLPIYTIACALGYAEPSTFHRAFKRWFGRTPQQVRAGA